MRRHRRRYLAPGQAWVRPAAAAASPGAAADAGVAGPGHGLALGSAADSRAREHRCPAAGKTLMSAPVSAIRSWALVTPKPGMAAQPGDLPLAGLAEGRDPRVQHGDLAGQAAGVADHHRQDEGVPGGEEGAVQGLGQPGGPGAHPAAGQFRQDRGVRLAGDDGLEHGAAGDAADVADARRELQAAILRQLRAAPHLRSAGPEPPMSSGGTNDPVTGPCPVTPASQAGSSRPALNQAESQLTALQKYPRPSIAESRGLGRRGPRAGRSGR